MLGFLLTVLIVNGILLMIKIQDKSVVKYIEDNLEAYEEAINTNKEKEELKEKKKEKNEGGVILYDRLKGEIKNIIGE